MVVRSQWRVFPSGSGAPVPAADYGSRLWVRSRQCRGAEPFTVIAAELDKAADRRPALAARVGPRHAAVSLSIEPAGHRLSAGLRRRDHPLRRKSVALSAGGRTRSVGVPRPPAGRASRAQHVSNGGRTSPSVDPSAVQLPLGWLASPAGKGAGL